jgi:hypothetical protein
VSGIWSDLIGTVRSFLSIGRGTAASGLVVNGAASTLRSLILQSGAQNRWSVRANTTAESGSDAGSNLQIAAWDDPGTTVIDFPIAIVRAAGGAVNVNRVLSLVSGSASAPALFATTDTDTGLYRVGADEWGGTAAAVSQWRWDNNGFRFERGLRQAVSVVSTTTTLDSSYIVVLCNAAAGGFTLNLPNATSGGESRVYEIIKTDSTANAVVLDPNGSQTINGASTFSLTTPKESVLIVGDPNSASWYIR